MPAKTKTPKALRNATAAADSVGGTYVYDKELGRLVKVSDRVPKVASKRGGASAMPGACGRMGSGGGCGGGACGS